MDMLDMLLQQTYYRHFEREANYHYLTNLPPRQESGFCSEVNILVLKEVTTKSVSMKLRRSTVLRSRRLHQREHVKDSESISVVLSDTDSSQSDSVEEIKDHLSVIRDLKRPVRKRWVLLKKWHPQRHRHREKGLLWTSLSRIRKLLAGGSDFAAVNRTEANCSRPHAFQQRNLRRCKYLLSIQTNLSITKAKPRHRKRSRSVVWPPVAGWKSSVKRKPSLNNTLSQQLSPLNLSVSVMQEDKLLVDEKISRLNAELKQNSDASSKQRTTNVRGKLNNQEVFDGIDGTRRALKFDDTPETVAAEQRKSPRQKHKRGEIREAQNGFQNEQQEEISEDSNGFRTPPDLFSVKPKMKRGNQRKVSASGVTKSSAQKPNFMSMLATLVKNQNQIIKESCK
ncbi:uncharacterized protein [Sinocyclocheilus grahami]|uniref:uncharacterized protein n=1 Tax=Sinocyclocheilus grahami TaxID=75366 RepID=UPI0007AD46AB|nr:PREDICTED: uncharacterized protein LOC107581688 [Sinocyclocheilus grahami]